MDVLTNLICSRLSKRSVEGLTQNEVKVRGCLGPRTGPAPAQVA